MICNAHILRLKVFKKNLAAKKKKEAKQEQIFTPLGNQKKIGTSLHSLVSHMAEECFHEEG